MSKLDALAIRRLVVKRIFQMACFTFGWAAVLFASAGRIDWPRGWLCLGLYVLTMLLGAALTLRKNPEVVAARATLHHAEAKPFDRVYLRLSIPLGFATPVVAGFDAVRFGWSPLPFAAVYPGLVLNLLSNWPTLWAMLANPFLETMVRIQHDRGHHVITGGPYRFVRHPMYVGVILGHFSVPLILGSRWAFVPAAASVALLIWRTAREDQTLRAELPGYEEYTRRTRYRLMPGLW